MKRILVEFIIDDESFEDIGKPCLNDDNKHREPENQRDENNPVHVAAALIQALCYDDGDMDGTFLIKEVTDVSEYHTEKQYDEQTDG
jgi:hypothetical protein